MTTVASPTLTTFTPDELTSFDRDGFVVVRGLGGDDFRRRMLDVVWDGLKRHVSPIEYEADLQYPGAPVSRAAAGGRTARRLRQAHSRGAVFTEWLQHPDVVGRLKQLLGTPLYCPLAHHNCIMTKQPEYSSETGWHQDLRYWSFTKPDLVNVWLALGEERSENGCLRVIPGTHRTSFSADRLDADLFLREDFPENHELIASAIDVPLAPGDVLFFHCRTFHAAGQNLTDDPKLSVVFTFRGEGNQPIPGTRSASLPELLIHA